MIVQLGDLLRRLLRAGERELTGLQDELDFVRLYLQLQQKRFADRLIISVPDRGAIPQVWVPSLILQPLVENAVLHGLAHHQSSVAIRVEVAVREETILLRVVNSVAPGGAAGEQTETGIGLKNVRERLAILFGGRASFSAILGQADEWIAEIHMPLLRDGSQAP
jgi:LytS/YehU family sensor histidine kinase